MCNNTFGHNHYLDSASIMRETVDGWHDVSASALAEVALEQLLQKYQSRRVFMQLRTCLRYW